MRRDSYLFERERFVRINAPASESEDDAGNECENGKHDDCLDKDSGVHVKE